MIKILLLVLSFTVASQAWAEEKRVIDVAAKYGISQIGIASAIEEAKRIFAAAPDTVVELHLKEGRHDLTTGTTGKGIIDVSTVVPGPSGRLIIKGEGMDRTVLVMDQMKDWIRGTPVHRVTFADMHMTTETPTVSQGHVTGAGRGWVNVNIQPGFPTPAQIFNPELNFGRYLRRYANSKTSPGHITETREQYAWAKAEQVSGREWRFWLTKPNRRAALSTGDLVAVKSKKGGNVYFFYGGSDVAFERVKWSAMTRGTFRGGIKGVKVIGCVIERPAPIEGQVPILASAGGGPQVGNPADPYTTDVLIEGNRISGTGDDAIALFKASGIVRHNVVSDIFGGRGILLYDSDRVVVEDNTLTRCAVVNFKHQSRFSETKEPQK